MSITSKYFGKTKDGENVDIFTLTNKNGVEAKIINYGGIVVSLCVPDKNNKFDDVVLGFDNLEDYLKEGYKNKCPYFGAIIGRHGNRIEDSKFELNGIVYNLCANNGKNHLHGGAKGFDKVIWDAKIVKDNSKECLQLFYKSIDGEENYPGNLDVKVTYTLTEDNSLEIEYFAISDMDTVVNLTNHTYFNLSGHASGSILDHQLMINSDKYTVINDECIPTGEIASVKGTPMDFTSFKTIKEGLEIDNEQLKNGHGFDHNFVLNKTNTGLEKAGELYDSKSGRLMEVYTTKPGMQFYSGNFLDGSLIGKEGVVYNNRCGLCLETQYFPNALKHKHFPSPILKAGEEYKHTTIYKFLLK